MGENQHNEDIQNKAWGSKSQRHIENRCWTACAWADGFCGYGIVSQGPAVQEGAWFEKSDLFVVNLEAPLCEKGLTADSPSGNGLRADGKIAEWMKDTRIDVAGIANNHLRDFKDEGVIQTLENLTRTGVLYAGGGKNISEAEKILLVHVKGLKIGFWMLAEKEQNLATEARPGTSFFNPDANVYIIPELRKQVDFLVIFVHAGHEFALVPSPRIRKAYRAYIEAGADLVVGHHHPHVPQGIERYKTGWIAYSLGNLVFDHDYVAAFKDTDHGYLFNVGISEHSVENIEIIPYYLRNYSTVETCTEKELSDYENMLKKISSCIIDDAKLEESWEKFVIWRWNQSRRDFHRNFSKNFMAEKNPTFIWMLKNCYGCPTAHELLEKAMELLLEEKISR
ncbi:MAG: Capsule synthesis protein, CapA [Candidatus Uhrbacteria bacterium GW2011_GWF2_39_13]|uniref:Capsule synthesis protein, CapA n=1 Tax=Candidatus Uhrbacteria bacterium GW2011_GWF2_39_13 TaxID=1618995 RepID=A0A0G0MJB2_9BACT|nr:MAG: Capsule synthesis protein, CapA [Candidatus Uhrbacteria bacterium GW2011_GWF2_39_13]